MTTIPATAPASVPITCTCGMVIGRRTARIAIIGRHVKVYRPFVAQCIRCGADVLVGPLSAHENAGGNPS
jgi:hypothetical protein